MASEHETFAIAVANAALDSQLPIQSNPIIYRGITNTNGTGCHTSSALQLLFHCFPRLRDELLNLAYSSANLPAQKSSPSDEENKHTTAIEKEFVYQLSWFFYLLANAEDIIAITQAATSASADNHVEEKSKQKKSKRKKKGINEKKAAAIDAFVAKSREGKTNMREWRNLVDSMKELNRKKYGEALGQVMNRRRSDEERSGTGKHNEEGQHIGTLGGGRKTTTCKLSSATLEGAGDAIDPTKFYEQLMSYTIEAMETRHHINTNNVGDAAVVFRCLIATLEFSVNRELTRLDELVGLIEIDNWNDGETKEGDENLQSSQRNTFEIRSCLAKVRDAMDYEWKGSLLSRIVGISQTGAVSSDNIITTTTITRTKKNGNIERPIPIPWQLPVLKQLDNTKTNTGMDKDDDSARNYFESLATSLHSVTICPNPIRGYNWTGLVKSGDVNEETTITKMDMDGNILVDNEEVGNDFSEKNDAERSTVAVEPPNVITLSRDEDEKGSEETKSFAIASHSDEVSVVSTTSKVSMTSVSSRTIGTQTDCGDDVEVKTITVRTSTVTTETETIAGTETQTNDEALGVDADTGAGTGVDDTTDESSTKDTSNLSSAIKFAVNKDACYAAAVTALTTAPKSRRSPRRGRTTASAPAKNEEVEPALVPTKSERDLCYAAAVAALAGSPSKKSITDIEISYTTSNSSNNDDENDDDISSDFNEESYSESSIDSKVPSADDEPSVASSETHSSAIETPSDIDNISLGSWTDSEADEEKKHDYEPLIRDISPVIKAQECDDANADAQVVSSSAKDKAGSSNVVPSEIAHSVCSNSVLAVSTLNSGSSSSSEDDSSASSSSSTSTSSTGSDSTSSTDSSSNSSSSSSSGSSSSDRDTAIIEVAENNDQESNAYNNYSTKKTEWTTRKETRVCQPLPKSLIFHLKRFTFSPSGHGEKLPGSLDIPDELNLRSYCLEQQRDNDIEPSIEQYCYQLTGALVHVDPVLSDDEKDHLEYGAMSEGHYVAFIRTSTTGKQDNKTWIELDDEFVRIVGASGGDESSTDTALNILSGCDVSNNEESRDTSSSSKRVVQEKERRYATLVVYSRKS